MKTNQTRQTTLPIKHNLTLIYAGSILIAVLMAVTSAAGLLDRTAIYPTEELLRTFVPNDVVNLIIGLPILLGSMGLARRGKLIGLLCWPGVLFFALYNYIAYVFALPFSWAFPIHLALAMLSLYTLAGLVASIDGKVVQQRLSGAVSEKFAGGVLAGFGFLFVLRVLGIIVSALSNGNVISETDLAVNISDFLISPALIIGGLLLWRRNEFGYVAGLGLLFQASILFVALIIFLLLQPLITTAPFAAADVAIIFAMGLICFAPFALFMRGVLVKRNTGEKSLEG
jgi:hypothetical protein